ncbi:carboxypeptidase-like regulatory domain-containing protein [Actinoplanes sp. TRM 88003]|uniref:alpha-amylase n=1 Tax=Paractinoplanes aksuensis TaxID=2939490 RepID=A0ABT1DJF2_9ACTN|nr:carboxypeptidase-like regulatory domain-containing protein [Actinoplanes aksuensis]MCO8270930.1 carboxypeptidase-like regulatory domain-containing protein [Actinoplanes aksuensis]
MRAPKVIVRTAIAAAVAGAAVATVGASPAQAGWTSGLVTGTVLNDRGAVVAGATISVWPTVNEDTNPVAVTRTNAAGKWRVADLDSGRYKVEIGLAGWSEYAPGRERDHQDARTYAVSSRRLTVVNSVVERAGSFAGRLTTSAGGPAAGVAVTVDDYNTAREYKTTTGADGSYSVKVPPRGDYVVSYRDGNFRQYAVGTTDQQQARHYTVASGQNVRVNDRFLQAASLTGRLVDAAGAPVGSATVRFIYTETAFELQTTTDADGRYTFDKLNPGPIKVAFRTADGRSQYAYQAAGYDQATEFTLALGTVTTVDDTLLP